LRRSITKIDQRLTIHWLYLTKLLTITLAILREISTKTSYQIVRWVFRHYTQLWQAICTSTLFRDLPSRFPQTSINSSIDHNLSGPNILFNLLKKRDIIDGLFLFSLSMYILRYNCAIIYQTPWFVLQDERKNS